jgi:nucleotide-binding universal stress UspA family protein
VELLHELCDQVDLLVIGSRRWGSAARVLLGSVGESLLQAAGCSVLAVPRPRR